MEKYSAISLGLAIGILPYFQEGMMVQEDLIELEKMMA